MYRFPARRRRSLLFHGRRELLTLSILIFTVGSLLCCLSKYFTELFAGRIIQGVGGGGIIALTMVISSDIIPFDSGPSTRV